MCRAYYAYITIMGIVYCYFVVIYTRRYISLRVHNSSIKNLVPMSIILKKKISIFQLSVLIEEKQNLSLILHR